MFNGKKHPPLLNDEDIKRVLTSLVTERQVAPSTQALALNAIVFSKTNFLNQFVGDLSGFNKSHKQSKLPVVLTLVEVADLLSQLKDTHYLMAAILYGSGLRRIELVRLRVQDIDFDYQLIRVINGKGSKNRLVTLADELVAPLKT